MTKVFLTNQTNAELDVRANWVQSDGNGSDPMQGILFDFRKKALFLPNRLAKQLNKYNSWNGSDTKQLAEIFSLGQVELEHRKWSWKIRWDWTKIRVLLMSQFQNRDLHLTHRKHFLLLARKLAKAIELVQQLNNQGAKKLADISSTNQLETDDNVR